MPDMAFCLHVSFVFGVRVALHEWSKIERLESVQHHDESCHIHPEKPVLYLSESLALSSP